MYATVSANPLPFRPHLLLQISVRVWGGDWSIVTRGRNMRPITKACPTEIRKTDPGTHKMGSSQAALKLFGSLFLPFCSSLSSLAASGFTAQRLESRASVYPYIFVFLSLQVATPSFQLTPSNHLSLQKVDHGQAHMMALCTATNPHRALTAVSSWIGTYKRPSR